MEQVLNARDLRVWFDVRIGLIAGMLGKEQKHVRAVDGISFDVKRGEVFCLVGESGCGKTTTGKALLRLNEPTSGNIFFEVPAETWARANEWEARLAQLEPLVAKLSPAERGQGSIASSRLNTLSRQAAELRTSKLDSRITARRGRIETTIEVLNVREKALREGQDSAVKRMVSRDRTRMDTMKTLGPWFTAKRARDLQLLQKHLNEAKFQLLRAEAAQVNVRKSARLVRRLERRIERMRENVRTDNPETRQKVKELQDALSTKERQLTELELARLNEERETWRSKLASLQIPARPEAAAQIQQLETEIAGVLKSGGIALELLRVRAELDDVRDQYDLATWGRKGRSQLQGRRTPRKVLKRRMRILRRKMQIIYQDPYESLNPKLSIFDIVAEPLLANRVVSTASEAEAVVAKALDDVGLRPSSEYMFRYPHELSGGQRQRVGIATALVVDPDFIVADEPVSMLDASVRTEILALLLDLKKRRDLTYLFITHDLGLAWILADRIAVMYLGKIVETGAGPEIIQNPRHPYTKALISVVPSPNPSVHRKKIILRGERPNPADIPGGCRFHPRCPMAVGICGWSSEEVAGALETLLKEDRNSFPEAAAVTNVTTTGPLSLSVATPDPARFEQYLWKRLQAVALGRPALGAIRRATPTASTIELALHEAVEPPLRVIKGDVSVACHLVEPEIAEPVAVAVTK